MHDITTPFGKPGFLVLAGSRLYGIDNEQSDYDYVGALVEPERFRIGLDKHHPTGKHAQHGFEQHEFKGDDYEGSIYSLWKLVEMFGTGNPTVLCLMYATPIRDDFGLCTDAFRRIAVSRMAGKRFLAYMAAQRKSMIGQRAKHVQRLELIEAHGYDTKFAGHLIRLGYQGIEYLTTGHITLPMPEDQRQDVLDIRAGRWTEDDVILKSEVLEACMSVVLGIGPDGKPAGNSSCSLPDEPDFDALSEWVVSRYNQAWVRRKILRAEFRAGELRHSPLDIEA